MQSVVLNGGDGDDTITFAQALPINVTVDGGTGNNTIVGPDAGAMWTIDGPNSGSADGITSFVNIQNLTGGQGDDTFLVET